MDALLQGSVAQGWRLWPVAEGPGPPLRPSGLWLCGPRQSLSRNRAGCQNRSPRSARCPRPAPSSAPRGWGFRSGRHPPRAPLVQAASDREPGCARRSCPGPHPRPSPPSPGTVPTPPWAPGATGRGGAPPRRPLSGSAGLRRGAPPTPEAGLRRPGRRPGPFPPRPLRTPPRARPRVPSRVSPGLRQAPFPVPARPPRSYRAGSSGRWAGRAGAQLAARPGCRKCQKTDPSAGGGREGAGGRAGRGGERREEGAAAAKPRAGLAAPERALQGPQSLRGAGQSSRPRAWRALGLTHTQEGLRGDTPPTMGRRLGGVRGGQWGQPLRVLTFRGV